MVTRTRLPRHDKARPNKTAAPSESHVGTPSAETWTEIQAAIGALGERLPGMREDLRCYASVQADRARLALRQAGSGLATKMLRMATLAAAFATASSLVVVGVASGVAVLLGGRVWLANIVTGVAVLAALVAGRTMGERCRARQRLRGLRQRYSAKPGTAVDDGASQANGHADRS